MAALKNPKREAFAQALLRNLISPTMKSRGHAAEAAARSAGFGGSALKDNARKWSNQKDVIERMAELAAPRQAEIEAEIALDVVKVKARLGEIIMAPIDFTETVMPKDVINAARQLSAIEGWNAPTNINVNKHVHTDWTTDELLAFVIERERRLEGNPAPSAGEAEPDSVH
jgi:hypothetical protein